MPELFVRCPTCKELGIVRSKQYPWTGKDCPTCLGRRFVRYGTEPGHQHVWFAHCACGKSGAEVTA